jgi:hypothetical protein
MAPVMNRRFIVDEEEDMTSTRSSDTAQHLELSPEILSEVGLALQSSCTPCNGEG